jgi:hypothetical protein
MADEIKALRELTECVRHFGDAAGKLAHVVSACADAEIAHRQRHATLLRLVHALRDCSLSVKNCIDQAPAAIKP